MSHPNLFQSSSPALASSVWQVADVQEMLYGWRGGLAVLLNAEWDAEATDAELASFVRSFDTIYCFGPLEIQVGNDGNRTVTKHMGDFAPHQHQEFGPNFRGSTLPWTCDGPSSCFGGRIRRLNVSNQLATQGDRSLRVLWQGFFSKKEGCVFKWVKKGSPSATPWHILSREGSEAWQVCSSFDTAKWRRRIIVLSTHA